MQATVDFKKLAVTGVQALQPYQPGKPIEELERELGISNILKLASNENPLGTSPKAQAALDRRVENLGTLPGWQWLSVESGDCRQVWPAQFTNYLG